MMKNKTEELHWKIHGFNSMYNEDYVDDTLHITPLNEVTSADLIDWDNCLAFLVPDYEEQTFNHLALTAIWLGIPTLASNQSSIGKFLLSLSCREAARGVVHLKGNIHHDTEAWTNKIKEVLCQDSRPTEWARQLTLHLQNNSDLWELNLPTLKNNQKCWLSANLNAALFAQKSHRTGRSDVLDEVAKRLKKSNIPDVDSTHSGISSTDSQVYYSLL